MSEYEKMIQLLEEARDLLLTAPVGSSSTISEYFAWSDKCRVWRKELSGILLSRIRQEEEHHETSE